MTELSFARSFLVTLDSRPTRLSADHVEDPRSYPARGAYILPKMARPMPKHQKLAPGQEKSVTVALKSIRNPPLNIVLMSQSLLTSILDLKTQVSEQASVPLDKIRILYKKKPVGDSKVLKDLIGEEELIMEFSVMVIGGTASIRQDVNAEAALVAQGTSGSEIVETGEFWNDLKGFLTQRLKDQKEGERLYGLFKKAWEAA